MIEDGLNQLDTVMGRSAQALAREHEMRDLLVAPAVRSGAGVGPRQVICIANKIA